MRDTVFLRNMWEYLTCGCRRCRACVLLGFWLPGRLGYRALPGNHPWLFSIIFLINSLSTSKKWFINFLFIRSSFFRIYTPVSWWVGHYVTLLFRVFPWEYFHKLIYFGWSLSSVDLLWKGDVMLGVHLINLVTKARPWEEGESPLSNFWFHLNFNALFRIRDNGAHQRHKRSVSSCERGRARAQILQYD